MMTEIKRLGILSVGKVCAITYGFLGLLILPFALIAFIANPAEGVFMIVMALLYAVMGFVFGVIFAALYNLAAKICGGIQLELCQVSDAPSHVVPPGPAPALPMSWRDR